MKIQGTLPQELPGSPRPLLTILPGQFQVFLLTRLLRLPQEDVIACACVMRSGVPQNALCQLPDYRMVQWEPGGMGDRIASRTQPELVWLGCGTVGCLQALTHRGTSSSYLTSCETTRCRRPKYAPLPSRLRKRPCPKATQSSDLHREPWVIS